MPENAAPADATPHATEATDTSTQDTTVQAAEAPDPDLSAFESLIEKLPGEKLAKVRGKLLKKAPITVKRGQTVETLDDEARLQHLASKGYGSSAALDEAKKLRSEAETIKALFDDLTSDDAEARGHAAEYLATKSPKAIEAIEQRILASLQKQETEKRLPPEAVQLKRLAEQQAERLAHFERIEAERQEAERQQQQQQLYEQAQRRYEKLAMDVLKAGQLPPEAAPYYLRRLAPLMKEAAEAGLDVPPEVLASALREQQEAEFSTTVGALDGEALLAFLGENTLKRIRTADLARLRAGNAPARQVQRPQQKRDDTHEEWSDPWRAINAMARGK